MTVKGQRLDLLTGAGASATGDAMRFRGGRLAVSIEGSTVNNTCKVQLQSANGTWIDVFTAGSANAWSDVGYFPPGQVRAVTGSGAADICAYAYVTN